MPATTVVLLVLVGATALLLPAAIALHGGTSDPQHPPCPPASPAGHGETPGPGENGTGDHDNETGDHENETGENSGSGDHENETGDDNQTGEQGPGENETAGGNETADDGMACGEGPEHSGDLLSSFTSLVLRAPL